MNVRWVCVLVFFACVGVGILAFIGCGGQVDPNTIDPNTIAPTATPTLEPTPTFGPTPTQQQQEEV